jgi:hypothetical protein
LIKVLFLICQRFTCLFSLFLQEANLLEKLQRDFLGLGGGVIGDEYKFHLLKWSTICTSLTSGGLEVKNMIQFN